MGESNLVDTTLKDIQDNWEKFASLDPLWAILSLKTKKGNKWTLKDFFATGEEHTKSVIDYLRSSDIKLCFGKALDFGCGVGRITQALAHYFNEVCGVDISPTMIELAKKYNRYGENCRYYVNSVNDLKLFSDNEFDFVFSVIVLQHIKPALAKNYIKEFIRVTSPSGLIMFQLPSEIISYKWRSDQLVSRIYHFGTYVLTGKKLPSMRMYGIKRTELVKFLGDNNAQVIDIKDDPYGGSVSKSYIYLVRKKS